MLPKLLRLSIPQSNIVHRVGRRALSPEITIFYATAAHTQFLVQVPKKVVKLANRRNRIRRTVHEVLRSSNFTQPMRMILRVNKDISLKKTQEISALLLPLLKKTGAL